MLKRKRRVMSLVMTAAMITTLSAGMGIAASADTTLTGSGTASDPYIINSQSDLESITDLTAYYKLGSSFTVSNYAGLGEATISSNTNTSSPYVSSGTGFSGTLDGNGKTINVTNRAITKSGQGGVVDYLAPGGTVKNLNVTGTVSASGVDAVGGVVGYNAGRIHNVKNSAEVISTGYNAGGIVGFNDHYYTSGAIGYIYYSSNSGAVTAKSKAGGITGENAGTIAACSNSGAVTNPGSGKNGAGGIAGRNGNNNTAVETGIIRNCYNNGNISCSSGRWGGGIAGFQNSLSSVSNCYSTKAATGYRNVGYIVGNDEGASPNNYASEPAGSAMNPNAYASGVTKTYSVWDDASPATLTYNATGLGIEDSIGEGASGTVGDATATVETDGVTLGNDSTADYTDLQSAINAAANTDSKNVYVIDTIDLNGTYTNVSGVTVKRSRTFGGILFRVGYGAGVNAPDTSADVTLSGITIDGNGYNSSGLKTGYTGTNLIRTYGGTLTLDSDVTLQNAVSPAAGGALHVQSGTVNSSATFLNNSARNGGAIAITSSSATSKGNLNITGGTISDSTATNLGPAVYMTAGTFALGGDYNISDAVYLANGSYMTLNSAVSNSIKVSVPDFSGNLKIAEGSSSYTITDDDVYNIDSDDTVSLIDGMIVLSR